MLENTNEEVVPAYLSDGEPVISQEFAESFNEYFNGAKEDSDSSEELEVQDSVVDEVVSEVKISEAEETVDENIISSPKRGRTSKSTSANSDDSNIIGSPSADKPSKKSSKKETSPATEEKVAIYSTKNVTWSGVGKVYRGYNIVTKEASEKWLSRGHTRLATPEEVAKEFGTD